MRPSLLIGGGVGHGNTRAIHHLDAATQPEFGGCDARGEFVGQRLVKLRQTHQRQTAACPAIGTGAAVGRLGLRRIPRLDFADDLAAGRPRTQDLVITHIFFIVLSCWLLWLQKPRKYRESVPRQADGNILRNAGKRRMLAATGSTRFACFSNNCTTMVCSISLTQQSPRKMWVMTRTQDLAQERPKGQGQRIGALATIEPLGRGRQLGGRQPRPENLAQPAQRGLPPLLGLRPQLVKLGTALTTGQSVRKAR